MTSNLINTLSVFTEIAKSPAEFYQCNLNNVTHFKVNIICNVTNGSCSKCYFNTKHKSLLVTTLANHLVLNYDK